MRMLHSPIGPRDATDETATLTAQGLPAFSGPLAPGDDVRKVVQERLGTEGSLDYFHIQHPQGKCTFRIRASADAIRALVEELVAKGMQPERQANPADDTHS